MTDDEARTVAAIATDADSGCSTCVADLLTQLARSFPDQRHIFEATWSETFPRSRRTPRRTRHPREDLALTFTTADPSASLQSGAGSQPRPDESEFGRPQVAEPTLNAETTPPTGVFRMPAGRPRDLEINRRRMEFVRLVESGEAFAEAVADAKLSPQSIIAVLSKDPQASQVVAHLLSGLFTADGKMAA